MKFNQKKISLAVGLAIMAGFSVPSLAEDRIQVMPSGSTGSSRQSTSTVDGRTIITNPLPIEGCNSGLRWSAGAGRYWCPGVVADPSPPPPPPPPPAYVWNPPPPPPPPPPAYVWNPPPPPPPPPPPVVDVLPWMPPEYDPPPVVDVLPWMPPEYDPPPVWNPPPVYVWNPPPPVYDPPPVWSPPPVVVADVWNPPPPVYQPPPPAYEPPPAPWVLPVFGPSDSGANGYVVIDYYTGQVTGTIGDDGVFTPPYAGGTADR